MMNTLLETVAVNDDSFIIGLCIVIGLIAIVTFIVAAYFCIKKVLPDLEKPCEETKTDAFVTDDIEEEDDTDGTIRPDPVTAKAVQKLMAYLENGENFARMIREDVEDAKRNKSIVFSSVTMVALTLIHTCVSISLIAKSKTRDKNYHICHSNYAVLDFCIYSYFAIRKDLLSSVSHRNIDKMDSDFISLLPKLCKKRFNIPIHITESLLNKRIDAYESLVDNHRTDELLATITRFVFNDFRDPFSEEIFVIDVDVEANLSLEISTLFKQCNETFIKNAKRIDKDFFAYDVEKTLVKNILTQVWKQSNLFESYLSSYNEVQLLIESKFQELIIESNKYNWNRYTIPEYRIKEFFVETLFDAFIITYYSVFKYEFDACLGIMSRESAFSAFRRSTWVYEPFKKMHHISTLMWKKLNGTIGDLRISWPDGYDPSDFYSSVGDEWIVDSLKGPTIDSREREKLLEIIKSCVE